ncbi:HAUS augmin-like complex subunit 3 [Anneissia japonica]|uniref:HAUS augmin-like complex subunit 3 n=1 Tax=Anneissia japonica TaxID=1529436 RepID=UPI0014259D4A|nr:HAUS augmin-like complex subunit 3 [Anneissia japonica]
MDLGRKLAETINSLGYKGSHELQAADFEWMCEDEEILPFLDWFCGNVNPSNIITPEEMEEFRALEASGEGILEGEQLEQALQSLTNIEEDDLTEDQLKKEIAELESEVKAATKRKEILIQQRNRLSVHHTTRQHKLTKLGAIESAAKKKYKKCLEQSHSDNNEMNTALQNLSKAFQDVSLLYSRSSKDEGADGVMFLAHLPLQDYYRAEERFTQELTKYTKKQFFEGITSITGQDEASWYQLLDISDPSTLVLKGEKEHVTLSNCKEIARLQALYPTSQKQYVKALAEQTRLQAACDCARQLITSIDQQTFPTKVGELSQQVQHLEQSLEQASRHASTLAENDLPQLIDKNAALQQTEILFGDYNLKIARQEYFTSKQDEVIKQLTLQRSRHEFLSMAFETEAASLRETHRLLTAARDFLDTNLKKHQAQMALLNDPSLQPTPPRATIDSRDQFVTRMYQILYSSDEYEERSKNQLFLTYEDLLEGAKQLASNLASLQSSLASTNSDQDSRLTELEHSLKVCEDIVYAGSASKGGQPALSPQPIVHAINQLDQALQSLEKSILDIMTEYSTKKKLLHDDPLLARQRTLYTSFFTNQGKLRRTLDDLSQQLQAQMVE